MIQRQKHYWQKKEYTQEQIQQIEEKLQRILNKPRNQNPDHEIEEYKQFCKILNQLTERLFPTKSLGQDNKSESQLTEIIDSFKEVYEFMKKNQQNFKHREEYYILNKFAVIQNQYSSILYKFPQFLKTAFDQCSLEELLYLMYFMRGYIALSTNHPDMIFDFPSYIRETKKRLSDEFQSKKNKNIESKQNDVNEQIRNELKVELGQLDDQVKNSFGDKQFTPSFE